MRNYSTKEISAFVEYSKRQDILEHGSMSRSRFDKLRKDPVFMEMVSEMRTEIIADVIRKLESCLTVASEELQKIIIDHETGSQTRLNAIQILFNSYVRLSERYEVLTRLEAVERALIDQNKPF